MSASDEPPPHGRGFLRQVLGGFAVAAVLLTRLPVAAPKWAPGEAARASWAFPFVGLAIGALAGLAFFLARHLHLGPALAALLALAAGLALTGALHEDGLADTADGFFGGHERAHKLAIMRDSRHGTFAVAALLLSFGLRGAALAEIGDPLRALLALLAAHAASRGLVPVAAAVLRPARADGLGADFGEPSAWVAAAAVLAGGLISLVALGPIRGLVGFGLAGLAALGAAELARRQIGGYTGDVLGAVQQLGEIAMLLAAAAQ
ncbi:MAG TPA: adenosylcobinamide-GDP ribazoletransferase [Stellaceae bacterium]|nr:adenosylcobinamide-GDP ribazoletransferase [Stellaceae bacterium]